MREARKRGPAMSARDKELVLKLFLVGLCCCSRQLTPAFAIQSEDAPFVDRIVLLLLLLLLVVLRLVA